MSNPTAIRILAPAKERGDLFTRLVSDLFLALGYEAPRLNIHKTGREIDVQARHRTEPRGVLAECKATARPIGGDEVNKFAGAVDVERRRAKGEDLAAYFVSLSGFTGSALEQDKDLQRLVLLDSQQVAKELVHGRIVVSPGKALERAGRAVSGLSDLVADDPPELLAHALGWVWAVRFRKNAQVTHVALVHADGELLAPDLAKQVLSSDRVVRGDLHRLSYLPPPQSQSSQQAGLEEARQAYFRYLAAECGELELEGLPADQEIGQRRLQLESLFVPLHLQEIHEDPEEQEPQKKGERLIVGTALERRGRLAILALPGGGKTTLLKRLAIAYAFPERRFDLGDNLPDREWFPLFFRCRQLGARAGEPITEILNQIGVWAELGEHADAFRLLVHSILREGRALLLIDGLDEIAEPGLRIAFVTRLRTFLSTYPGVDVVVTSREAGFRVVAGALSAHCDHYRIADFDREDIERLTVAWHLEVIGDRKEVEAQARSLAESIWNTDRVRRLAVNPLLLTTLLLVRRWVGQLPSRRSVLYEKAIEVLLMTWNLQGFEPLDLHEVKPQLAFLAWHMMEDGHQRISGPKLKEVLREARRQMPEILAYARMGIDEFVERVERRSGVLVLSGHLLEEGRLVPVYEFRHLTFQEYLAAQALVEGTYPHRSDSDTLVLILEQRFQKEDWKEVISLVAVLAGRRASPLIEAIVGQLLQSGEGLSHLADILVQCLLDEVQIPPALVERTIEAISRSSPGRHIHSLACSVRYSALVRRIVWRSLVNASDGFVPLLTSWRLVVLAEQGKSADSALPPSTIKERWLSNPCAENRAELLLSMAFTAFCKVRARSYHLETGDSVHFSDLAAYAVDALHSVDLWEQVAGVWALVWLARVDAVSSQDAPEVVSKLLGFLGGTNRDLVRFALSALGNLPLVSPEMITPTVHESIDWENSLKHNSSSVLLAQFYNRQIVSEQDLVAEARRISKGLQEIEIPRAVRELLEQAGDEGRALLREWGVSL